MSQGVSSQEFLDRLSGSGLFSAEDVARAADVAASSADGPELANSLVSLGVLTDYQRDALCEGKHAELRIGNYEVLDRLGAGGMGAVFKARHSRMKRVVALKVLARNLAQDATFVQRFQREVETIARLSHPNIVMAFDADEDDVAGHFLVMEYVKGQDFASLVQGQGPLDVGTAVDCILQAARGLDYAHGQGIIHRDIKPANLLRDVTGLVKVTDLGLARLNNPEGPAGGGSSGAITQAGGIVGTVDYMPPEQAFDSVHIDHRADIYSLGATLHFLLLGRPPYPGQTMMATLLQHREAPIPAMAGSRPEIPAGLDAVFRRMMAKVPADRYQTMAEVAKALETVGAGHPGGTIASPPPGTVVLPGGPVAEFSTGVWDGLEASSPASARKTTQTLDPRPTGLPRGSTLKVVLVEPSRTLSGIIRKYLQGQGVQDLVAVASGQEALRAVRREHPDAIISALHLADMTGIQLAQLIRGESKADAPGFVLISSEEEGADAGTLSRCGKAVVLHKPFTPEQLFEALRMVSTPPAPLPSETRRDTLRALIVDDSAAARRHVLEVLRGLGLSRFVEAADGAQAVAAVAGDAFDLIVTDYNMPFMDGRALVGYLKQLPATASIPIIMVTTEEDPDRLEAVRQLGVAAICDKSFPPEAVREVLDRIVSPT